MIQLIHTGPALEFVWLRERMQHAFFRVHWYRDTPPQTTYRVDILDEKGTTLLYSEEYEAHDKHDAITKAESVYTLYGTANRLLPVGDGFDYNRVAKYRRE